MTNDLRGAAMTRDETIALFLQGREAWNAWAKEMLAERQALEEAGEWAAQTGFLRPLEGKNDKTKDWIARASVDFSRCRVVRAGAEAAAAESEEESAGGDLPVKSIEVTDRFDCSGFIFPANAFFTSAQFHDTAWFDSAQFHARAFFDSA
jgi:hypothetical protein